MFLDQKPFIYLWRPFYRHIYVPALRPLLNRLFLDHLLTCLDRIDTNIRWNAANSDRQLALADRKLEDVLGALCEQRATFMTALEQLCVAQKETREAVMQLQHQITSLGNHIATSESETKAQWLALESLLLTLVSSAGLRHDCLNNDIIPNDPSERVNSG